ncbi:hypothetical protein ACFLUG_03465 [Chloroflexota bacterium]
MIIDCSQCGERINFAEPIPYGKVYTCKSCRSVLILAREEPAQSVSRSIGITKTAKQLATMVLLSFLLVSNFGPSVAAASPGEGVETPLEGIVAVLTGTSTDSKTLLKNVRALVAQYERKVISQSLQYMRIMEGMREVPPVLEPTNDMAVFPTPEYSLFPDYIEWQYSQFKYTVNNVGTVSIANEESPDT